MIGARPKLYGPEVALLLGQMNLADAEPQGVTASGPGVP